jgi:anti-sigma-K factor RskA
MTGLSDDMRHLASDYVLGLMPAGESRLFEEIIERDPELARHVGALRDQLLPLDLSAPPQELPEGFFGRVQAALGSVEEPRSAAPPEIAAPPRPANVPRAPSRSLQGLIAAALVGVVVGFGFGWQRPLPQPQVIAVLLDDQGVPQAVVEDYGDDTATVRFVAEIDVPADRSLQVWTLPSAEIGATSLGVLDRTAPTRLTFEDLPGPMAQQLYEVTLEPAGGSPTGRPTGPIIGKGFAAPQV